MKRSEERTQFLADVLVTACEGGTNYWGEVWDYRPNLSPEKCYYSLRDLEGDPEPIHTITVDSIAKGIRTLLLKHPNAWVAEMVREGDRTNDAGEIDAIGADAIVQCAIFGEIVYG